LTGCLFVVEFTVFGIFGLLVKTYVLTAFLIAITFIDYDHQLILDKLLIWVASAGVVIHLSCQDVNVFNSLAGALAGSGDVK
jgi:leader peptidase (prepilin peptidase)/N-methyltransferase